MSRADERINRLNNPLRELRKEQRESVKKGLYSYCEGRPFERWIETNSSVSRAGLPVIVQEV
jgi:hypothetical protein